MNGAAKSQSWRGSVRAGQDWEGGVDRSSQPFVSIGPSMPYDSTKEGFSLEKIN